MIAVNDQSGRVFLFGKRFDVSSHSHSQIPKYFFGISFFFHNFYVKNDSNSLFSFIKLILNLKYKYKRQQQLKENMY
ncbi:hypothetical protein J2T18_004918 [Paenibacillus polymyxa]|nr:hypothetical protein [Paenibacillus polymyxa]